MMMTRDEFITVKVLNECWHEWYLNMRIDDITAPYKCMKCGQEEWVTEIPTERPNFSTWQDFGYLWERCITKKKWLSKFMNWWYLQFPNGWEAFLKWERLTPTERSNEVAKFHGWKEE